jgi:hypothetical protein
MVAKYVLWVAVAAACSNEHAQAPDAAVLDAAADCTALAASTPLTVAGSSPQGSLDGFHYASAVYIAGTCPAAYVITVTQDGLDPACTREPSLVLTIFAPFTAPGSDRAEASVFAPQQVATDQVTFEATQLDPPDAATSHITGHFVSHDPAWSFDISVDLASQSSSECI